MEDILLPRYTFEDITVYMRTRKGDYANITDYTIADENNERLVIESNSDYVLMFCSYFYNSHKKKCIRRVCDVSIEDLLALAGIGDACFPKRFKDGCDDNIDLLSMLCARKITNYNYGTAIQSKENPTTYSFFRQGWHKVNGKNRRYRLFILEKNFYEA